MSIYKGTNVPKQPTVPPMPKKRRYIDESILVEKVYNGEGLPTISRSVLVNCVLPTIPTADVVEIVRCKDCKHKPNGYTDDDDLRYPNFPHEENNPCPCQVYEDRWYSWIPNDDFFCSYGERAEE